ncbi:MAG: GDP-mannose 4,6-dehydratase [Acidobacteriota bacterium]
MATGPVVVTGAGGFVGQHLVRALTTHGPVLGWYRPDGGHPDAAGVAWTAVEMLDRAAVEQALADTRPAAIYHLAGVAHVGDSWANAEATFAGNVLGTSNLFDAMHAIELGARVLVTGSATIYQSSSEALTEDSPIAPNTPYGTSKLAQELVALAAWAERGIPVLVTRSFNHTGPLQSPAFAAPGFARQLARIEAGLAPPTISVGNLEAQRDIADVRDTVRAYVALMASGRAGHTYNVCAGRTVSIRQVLDGLVARVSLPVTVAIDPARMRPADTPVVLGSHAKLTADTGWTPSLALDDTLDALLAYWREQVKTESP